MYPHMRGGLPRGIAGVMIAERGYPRSMATSTEPTRDGDGLDAAYAAAVVEWREWDRRAVEAQSCDVAIAAQRSLEVVRRLERRRERE